jgi:hypothetical protein
LPTLIKAAVLPAVILALLTLGLAEAARPGRARSAGDVSTPVNLSHSPTVASSRPQIALTADGTVHVIWEEGNDVRHVYRRSGQAWGPNPPLTVYYGGSDPALAAYGNLLGASFSVQAGQDTDTALRYKLWDGVSRWKGAQKVSDLGQQPDIAFQPDDGSVWVAWINNAYDYQPYYSHFVNGVPESGPITNDSQKAQGPRIGVDAESNVWVAWKEEAQPTLDTWITCRRQTSGTRSFGLCSERADVLRGETYQANAPDLALGEGACITWDNVLRAGSVDVYLACDAGGWVPRNLSQSPGVNSLAPRLTLDRTWGPQVLWQERLKPTPAILYRPGVSPPEPVVQGMVGAPAIAFESHAADGYGTVHAVWEAAASADVDADTDIYYNSWRVDVPTPTPTATATSTASPTGSATATRPTPTPGTPSPTPGHHVYTPYLYQSKK